MSSPISSSRSSVFSGEVSPNDKTSSNYGSKRLKVKQTDFDRSDDEVAIASFLGLPEDAIATVISFCDVRDLLMLWNTSRLVRSNTTKQVLEQQALKHLAFNCTTIDNSGEKYGRLHLQPGWSHKYATKSGLVQHAEEFASQHILFEYDYDKDKAVDMLQHKGSLQLSDFDLNEERYRRRQRAARVDPAAATENDAFTSWDLSIYFRRVDLVTAKDVATGGFSALLETVPKVERYALHMHFVRIRQCLCALFKSASSSVLYGGMKMNMHHKDYPSGDQEEALMFCASNGQEYQLFFYHGFQHTLRKKIR